LTERYLEYSDVNGNHCTADAAGLVVAGLFFGRGRNAVRWLNSGWELLCQELPRQVLPDGADFEGSLAYHRLVLELFLLPALYRQKCGLAVPAAYQERLIAMARFTRAYCRDDGTIPLIGDADDARALPLGSQAINDHRYLLGLVGSAWNVVDLTESFSGSRSEILWLLGPEAAAALPDRSVRPAGSRASQAFPDSGYYVLANDADHVFIDCASVGLAGRGGHGHNDCLSFEAVLDGCHLVTDCGSFVYTASASERNTFRSTAYHNTARVDGEEINRFNGPHDLWTLRYDARPHVRGWHADSSCTRFHGAHLGFQRLPHRVTPVRTFRLDHARHMLELEDAFEGEGIHQVQIPLHLAPGVDIVDRQPGKLTLRCSGRKFCLEWNEAAGWELKVMRGRCSPSYGVLVSITCLQWSRSGELAAFRLRMGPVSEASQPT
jgi:hypothetical protein